MYPLEAINTIAPGHRSISIVGGGGKTSLLFALASDARAVGVAVLAMTTTHIYDPRDEHRPFDVFLMDPSWATDASRLPSARSVRTTAGISGGFVTVVGSGIEAGKLVAVHPAVIDACPADWGLVLVEADGARHLPIKAPAEHEPVIPAGSELVCAVIGMDCLGAPLDAVYAFRPELIARATGLALGHRIDAVMIAALSAAPQGCFKGTPAGAIRMLMLNKADLVSAEAAGLVAKAVLETGAVDAVAIANLETESADRRIREIFVRGARDATMYLV